MPTGVAAGSETAMYVEQERIMEALALIRAAGDVFNEQGGRQDSPLGDFFLHASVHLQEEIFGAAGGLGATDDEWEKDPVEVAIWARSSELAADAIEASRDSGIVAAYRLSAKSMREAGSIDVPFPNELAAGGV